MGHTPEQRDQHALCGARKKNGDPCRAWAGMRTDHPGYGPCWVHGGATGSHRKAALRAQAKQAMVALSVPVENAEPNAILLQELRYQAGHVAFLQQALSEMEEDELGDDRSQVILERLDQERDRLHRLAGDCAKAGIADKAIKLEHNKADLWASAVRQAMQHVGLSKDQITAIGEALGIQIARGEGVPEEEISRRIESLDRLMAQIADKDRKRIEREAQKLAGLVPAAEMGMAIIDAPAKDVRHPRNPPPNLPPIRRE